MADILDDMRSHSEVCRMTGNAGCLTDKLAARAVTEIERLRAALERIRYQAANRCEGDGEIALLADLEKIEKWADVVID